MKFVDHYEVLGVLPTASIAEIKTAFRRAVVKHHPDRNADSADSVHRTKEINEAHRVLADPILRARFDDERRRHHATPPPGFMLPWQGPRSAATSRTPVQPAPRSASRSSSGAGSFLSGIAAAVAVGTVAYVAAKTNSYDPAVDRYRARDGRFRGGRFF